MRDHPLVAQCIVVGNDRPYIAALVTLDSEAVEHWLQMRGKTRQRLSTWRATRTWRPRCGGRWSPRTPWASQAESIRYVPDTGEPVHRGARAADAVAEVEAEGDPERVRDEAEALYRA